MRNTKTVKNNVFEIPYNKDKITFVNIPNIHNKTFKISKWFIKVGDFIEKNQIICELESNSITIEFESLSSGKLVGIKKSQETLYPGDEICKIENVKS
jgi:biotin carboxyl carrier protein